MNESSIALLAECEMDMYTSCTSNGRWHVDEMGRYRKGVVT
jgi:hypothetical protein